MYRVKLSEFEGPLDLLLFFIKRDELDITDIPIARITRDFLEYLRLMASLDLEIAGEFILMAATLMQIKVRMLLPGREEEDEEEDPRAELVRRLVEYKRFKEMAGEFGRMEEGRRGIEYRAFFEADTRLQTSEENEGPLKDISVFNLIAAYKTALNNMPRRVVHQVDLLNVTVDEQMSFVVDFLRVHGPTTFLRIVAHMTEKIRVIVTVMAILELVKNHVIGLAPTEGAEDIRLVPVAPLAAAARA